MNILELRALRGPNYHSRYPTIHMLLDIGGLEELPTHKIAGFPRRLEALLPGLREHRCSPGYRGGFIERLERGTWAAHVVEHVAIELQCMAGIPVGFGKTRGTSRRGVYTVAFRYRDEEAGLQAARFAVDIVDATVAGRSLDAHGMAARLRELSARNGLGPSTASIVAEARRRGIPVLRDNEAGYVQLGHGARQQRIQATMTGRTSAIAVEIADDKEVTKRVLARAGVPVPRGRVVETIEEALAHVHEAGFPVVVKPLVGNHGRGVTTNVQDEAALRRAFEAAQAVRPQVVVERHLPGADFRLLVIGHKLVAAARRDPAQVVGDGVQTVRELVAELNADPRRGEGHAQVLTRVELDGATDEMLARQGLALGSVPSEGRAVVLKPTPNISSGGTATDVTDEVHPVVRAMAERIGRLVGLDILGIDVVAPHLRRPLQETGGGVVEVNAAPGFRMHLEPSTGQARNVAKPVLDVLFPGGSDGRIPIVAVTGTNGKTTTVRLISHILRAHGARVGTTTTVGVEVGNHLVLEGDYSGPEGTLAVLREPTVDHAVLEIARGGILRRGLAFEECDVGVFLNVAADHLGEGGIDTIEDLARLKGTILEAVRPDGTGVLNAEDPQVMALAERVRGRRFLFALDPNCPALRQHLEDGGLAVTVDDGWIVLRHGGSEFQMVAVRDVPITLDGRAGFNVQNALAAVAACVALDVPQDVICAALTTFSATVGQLPGRMNLFDVGPFRVMVDYGHNAAALRALADVVPHLARGRIINVASMSGNRRDEDLRAFGAAIAAMYHHVVLCDADPRGRPRGETVELVHEGLRSAGFPDEHLLVILDEEEAVEAALAMAAEGDLVVLQVDDVPRAIARVRQLQADHGAVVRLPPRSRERGAGRPAGPAGAQRGR